MIIQMAEYGVWFNSIIIITQVLECSPKIFATKPQELTFSTFELFSATCALVYMYNLDSFPKLR